MKKKNKQFTIDILSRKQQPTVIILQEKIKQKKNCQKNKSIYRQKRKIIVISFGLLEKK